MGTDVPVSVAKVAIKSIVEPSSETTAGLIFPGHQKIVGTRCPPSNVVPLPARSGPWKLHVKMREPVNYGRELVPEKPVLYHLERDISEQFDVAKDHPEIVAELLAMMQRHQADIEPHEDMLAIPLNKN